MIICLIFSFHVSNNLKPHTVYCAMQVVHSYFRFSQSKTASLVKIVKQNLLVNPKVPFFPTAEDFSQPPLLGPVDFNTSNTLDNAVPCVSRVLLYMFESKSTVSRAAGDGELLGHRLETSDLSEC